MPTRSTSRGDFHENSIEIRSSNYQEELNSRKFRRIITIADYFSGILGYKVSLANADSIEIKWKKLAFPFLITVLCQPLSVVKFFIQFEKDVYGALAVLPSVEGGLAIILQRCRILYLEVELKKIYGDVYKRWDEEVQNGINDEIVKNAKKHISYFKFHGTLLVLVLIFYLLRPFEVLFTYYVLNGNQTFTQTNILPLAYPFAIDTMWKWGLCNFYEGFSFINGVMMAISNDLSFIHMCALLSLLIQAVGDKLQNIVRENDSRTNDGGLETRLLVIGRQHCELREICEKIEDAFNPGLLIAMLGGSIHLCACAIHIEKALSENHFGAAVTWVIHLSAVMIRTAVYCNTAEDISHQLEKISQKIYQSQWIGHSKRFQKMMITMMLKSNIPFKFRTYGLYNVDRAQLTKIIALAYNLVVALRNIRSFKNS